MDKHDLYLKACEQFGSLQHPSPPMRIDWMTSVAWHLLFERELTGDACLVYLHVEKGIGIADRGIKGYTPTPAIIGEGVNGQQAVDWFNQNILGISFDESMNIFFSTFGTVRLKENRS